ncbi:MAG: DUF1499 domain-containing protein [Verrucomicrobia bacterium]|mgnify:FL=1|jgi:uncharacterized protein (DUF1499 family)|nr:DUF1499 domain-containing protein [Verrucomicrobiota bacterium]
MCQTLLPCPQSPNCVCSLNSDTAHFIEPITIPNEIEMAWEIWTDLIRSQCHAISVSSDELHIQAVFRTPVFRFKDDVECLLDTENKVIHVRSASRVGYWDLGANRKRIERLRSAYKQATTIKE